jgi:hypothetical protein
VAAQYQLIDKLVRSAQGETRCGLLRVGAAYAALVGWLYQQEHPRLADRLKRKGEDGCSVRFIVGDPES